MTTSAQRISLKGITREQMAQAVSHTPASGKHRGILSIAAVATLGSLLFGYDTGVISGALPYMYMPDAAKGLQLTSLEERSAEPCSSVRHLARCSVDGCPTVTVAATTSPCSPSSSSLAL